MAGAEAAVESFFIEKPEIPQRLLDGTKFLKWPKADGDDSAVPITLRVDENGYLLYWKEPNKDTETLEISNLRDTRYGKYAREPKQDKIEKMILLDPKIGQMLGGSSVTDHCFTITYGPNLVDVSYLNFIVVQPNPLAVIKEWADYLLTAAYHPTTRHLSVASSVEKAYTKLRLETNHADAIPVKKLMKLLGGRSSRVESALSAAGLPTSLKKTIDREEFPLIRFKKLLQLCSPCQELDGVFARLGSGGRRIYITHQKFREFINTVQRDPKLNEILYPFQTEDETLENISNYEMNLMFAQKGQLTQEGFDSYLQSDDNLITDFKFYTLYQDMGHPLSHYFINSSHNTYLSGNQYKSRSTAEMYRQVLLSGCRCVELDCWERDEELIINHGFTFCTPVPFKEVIEAIDECAFTTSPYPVILSFENHVESKAQQAKMAQICRDVFKDKLLVEPLDEYPIGQGNVLPPPKDLLYRIIVKNKKQKIPAMEQEIIQEEPSTPPDVSNNSSLKNISISTPPDETKAIGSRPSARSKSTDYGCSSIPLHLNSPEDGESIPANGIVNKRLTKHKFVKTNSAPLMNTRQISEESIEELNHISDNEVINISTKLDMTLESLPEETSEEELVVNKESSPTKPVSQRPDEGKKRKTDVDHPPASSKNSLHFSEEDLQDEVNSDESEEDDDVNEEDRDEAYKESKAYEAMSSLVNYIQPVRFKSFEISEKHDRSNEISSFTETAALRLITTYPVEYVNYNRRQTSRIYPKGSRVDSSNYWPQVFWNAGCQFVSLNFQTLDLPMQMNLAMFEFNGNCGFLLKPECMRRKDRNFDPFTQNLDGVIPTSLTVRIISGQFLSQQKVSTYVEVDLYGLLADTKIKKYKTKTVDGNPTNPRYDSHAFKFEKIVLPSLAVLRISVSDTGGNLIGHRFIRVDAIKPGYRYITLRNESNQPLLLASLFIFLEVKDYVLPAHEEFVKMLVDPISFLPPEEREKRKRIEREAEIKKLIGPVETESNKAVPSPIIEESEVEMKPNNHKFSLDVGPLSQPDIGPRGGTLRPNKPRFLPDTGSHTLPVRGKPVGKDLVMAFFKEFTPQSLNDIKSQKPYKKLEKVQEKNLNQLRKKNLQKFLTQYRTLFGVRRRSSVLDALKKVAIGRRKSSAPSEDSPKEITNDDKKKKDELIELFQSHLHSEKQFLLSGIDIFVKEFENIVRIHQTSELKTLVEMSSVEQVDFQKRKNLEKQNKIKQLCVDLSRQDLSQRKKQIDELHFAECVRDRTLLSKMQKERENSVKKQQHEILECMDGERDAIRDRIEREYDGKVDNIKNIFDVYCEENRLVLSSNMNGTTSYPDPKDGPQRTQL